ncbi:MAG: hypothetical protein COV76_04585 [Candidatus Omnitrophica bacterium CG11_big_fil_rev_8_21_14_0_20_64_10]|nr:MAG: hypothetical protein COV76_04585 [Candidatus Omnitrophica bacterium CG11_big_fil_rev_8_21_14_0_20_64_10]
MLELILGAAAIFLLRVTDVSIGTLRLLTMMQGRRLVTAFLGFLESGLFITAVVWIFQTLDHWWNILAYAGGFACGTALGMTLEGWIASGTLLIRVISREKTPELAAALRKRDFGVTLVEGKGQQSAVAILFAVVRRRRGRIFLEVVKKIDSKAFVTVEPIRQAYGGHLPNAAMFPIVRK